MALRNGYVKFLIYPVNHFIENAYPPQGYIRHMNLQDFCLQADSISTKYFLLNFSEIGLGDTIRVQCASRAMGTWQTGEKQKTGFRGPTKAAAF